MTGRGLSLRHELVRIFVAQLIEGEVAGLRNGEALCEQILRVQARELLILAQMTLSVRIQVPASLCDGHIETHGGQRILQLPSLAYVHVNIAACDEQQPQLMAERLKNSQPLPIGPLPEQLDCDAGTGTEMPAQPSGFIPPPGLLRLRLTISGAAQAGHPQNEALPQACSFHVLAPERVLSLDGCTAAAGDQPAQLSVAFPVDGERDELHAALEAEFRSDEQLQRPAACRYMGPHHSRDGAFIRDGERRITQLDGALDELLRMGGAAQEREVAEAMQLRIRAVPALRGRR